MDRQPVSYTERWTPGEHFHSHVCGVCHTGWCCEVEDCRLPDGCKCLECWARESGDPLPGGAFVLVSVVAAVLVLVAFLWAVWPF